MGLPLLVALAVVLGAFAAFVGARYAVTRRAGATSLREGLFITRERWDAASPLLKVGFLIAGPLAMYVLAVVLFFIGFKLVGQDKPGEPTQISVAEGKPAAKAGLRDGDKILAVDGTPIATFEELSQAVQSGDDHLLLEIERGTDRSSLQVIPEVLGGRHVIGVRPHVAHADLPVPDALGRALGAPAKVAGMMLETFGDLVFGPKKSELIGPTRMVAEMKAVRPPGVLDGVLMGAAFASYLMVLLTLLSPLSIPWRGKKKA